MVNISDLWDVGSWWSPSQLVSSAVWDQSQMTQIKVHVAVRVPLTLFGDCLTDKTLRQRGAEALLRRLS